MRISQLALITFAAIGIGACCKGVCPQETIIWQLTNFKVTDVDTMQLVRFTGDGQFANPLDSIYLTRPTAGVRDSVPFNMSFALSLDNDYEFRVPALNTTYKISDIGSKTVDCLCSSGTFEEMASYRLNGVLKQLNYVDIRR